MKVPLEILTVTVLIWLGWTQSYQEQWNRIMGRPPERAATGRPGTRSLSSPEAGIGQPPAAPPQPNWMRRPTILDRQN
jgi:hypothetical protein